MRPLRRDAAENLEKLRAAANQVFTENGLDGTVEEVARVAGVGMGTLYRRFPTKQALIDDLVGGVRRELLALAREAALRSDGTGLEVLLVRAGRLQAAQLGCLSRLWDHSDAELDAMVEFRRILRDLLAAAQAQRRIRADVTSTDITTMLWSLRGVIEMTVEVAPNAWHRHLELLIAGLRPVPTGGFATTLKAKALTEAQARRVTSARGRGGTTT